MPYNDAMRLLRLLMAILLFLPVLSRAETSTDASDAIVYEKPLAAEREANGYDPEGVEYKQNRLEDFQVVFVETAPFAFLLSYGLTALASYAINGSAKMDKHNTPYLAAGTLLLAGGAAYLSVSGKPYDPKSLQTADLSPKRRGWAIQGEWVRLRF
jgi:hypothetical protein